jgi:hypothetical protein
MAIQVKVIEVLIVSWSYTMTAASGSMQISKNGSNIVNVSSGQSGSFNYSSGDYITISIDATANTSLTALVDGSITDSTGVLYSNSSTGSPNTSLSSGSYYPTGAVTIIGVSDEF